MAGSVENALLISNLVVGVGTLALVYVTARRMGAGVLRAAVAVALCGGSGAFIAMSHQFLTETIQAFSAALMVYVVWGAERRPYLRSISMLLVGASIGLLAKTSNIIFIGPPLLCWAVVLVFSRETKAQTSLRDGWVIVAALLLSMRPTGGRGRTISSLQQEMARSRMGRSLTSQLSCAYGPKR